MNWLLGGVVSAVIWLLSIVLLLASVLLMAIAQQTGGPSETAASILLLVLAVPSLAVALTSLSLTTLCDPEKTRTARQSEKRQQTGSDLTS
jgi:hypothetical protein